MGGTTVALIASQVLMAVSGVLAARALGPDGRGVVTAVLSWPMVLGWLALVGVNTSSTVRVAGGRGEGLATTLGNAAAHSVVTGGAVALIAIAFVPRALADLGPDASNLAVWTLVTIPTLVMSDILGAINIALGRVALANWCRVVGPIVLVAGTLALIVCGAVTPASVVALTIGSGLVTLVVSAVGLPWRKLGVNFAELRSDLRFGIKAHVAGLLGLANVRLDLLLMSAFVSSAQVGYYGVANNLMMPVGAVAGAIAILLTPRVARMASADDETEVAHSQVTSIRDDGRRSVIAACIGGVLLAGAAPLMVPLLFGPAFQPVVLLVWVLIPGYIARSYAWLTAAGALGARRPWVGNLTEGAGFVVTVALLPVLLPKYDALGAAITSTAAYTASAIVAFLAMRRLTRQARSTSPTTEAEFRRVPAPVQTGG